MTANTSRPDKSKKLRQELHTVLKMHREDLVEGLVTWLRDPVSQRCWGPEAGAYLRQRASRLLQAFLGAIQEGLPENFISYVQRLEALRGDTVNGMRNLWLALTLLEDKIWRIVIREVPLERQVTLLSWVTQIIGATKDRLACMLMAQLDQSRFRTGMLSETLSLLSRGTDPAPEEEPGDQSVTVAG
jgi:hypothetical protein